MSVVDPDHAKTARRRTVGVGADAARVADRAAGVPLAAALAPGRHRERLLAEGQRRREDDERPHVR
jgi:hypothetical protein